MSTKPQQQIIESEKSFSVPRVAIMLNVGESTIHREIKAGRLIAYKYGKNYKIYESDLLKYKKTCRVFKCFD